MNILDDTSIHKYFSSNDAHNVMEFQSGVSFNKIKTCKSFSPSSTRHMSCPHDGNLEIFSMELTMVYNSFKIQDTFRFCSLA